MFENNEVESDEVLTLLVSIFFSLECKLGTGQGMFCVTGLKKVF